MANLYLSFLGTNDYIEAVYVFKGQKKQTRFIQESTVWLSCRDWSEEDRIIVFTTSEAKKKNWMDRGDEHGSKGLRSCLEAISVRASISNVDIPMGASEQEIWNIFNIVLDQIRENDFVVFDITHAFRSIPMLAIVILNYAKVIKNIRLTGIYYGAFEVLGPAAHVKQMAVEQRLAPVFDLTAFDELLGWSLALDRFMNTGDASAAVRLARIKSLPVLKLTAGEDKAAKATERLAKRLEDFSQAIVSCRGKKISESADHLKKIIGECLELEAVNPALVPLLGNLDKRLAHFRNDFVSDGFQSVQWCIDHNLIQQGYTLLEESIITWIATGLSLDFKCRDYRVIIPQALAIAKNNFPLAKWHKPACDFPDIVERCLSFIKMRQGLEEIYAQISQCRNDINHAGIVTNDLSFENLKNKLAGFLRKINDMM